MTFDKKTPCLSSIFVTRLDMHVCVRVSFLLSLAPRHSGSAISIVPAACLCVCEKWNNEAIKCVCLFVCLSVFVRTCVCVFACVSIHIRC